MAKSYTVEQVINNPKVKIIKEEAIWVTERGISQQKLIFKDTPHTRAAKGSHGINMGWHVCLSGEDWSSANSWTLVPLFSLMSLKTRRVTELL